ncbi:hypothetical protein HDU96_003564 [Phlyctochytrium bullatum]|nr:hypothetical protein HDU96_003564 [Phlyctochytrium bullatum]
MKQVTGGVQLESHDDGPDDFNFEKVMRNVQTALFNILYSFVWTIKLFRTCVILLATFLFVPFLGIFTAGLSKCGDESDLATCWSATYRARSVGSIVLIVVMLSITFFARIAFFDPDPISKNIACRPHSRSDLLFYGGRGALCIMFMILRVYGGALDSPGNAAVAKWIMNASCLGYSGWVLFSFLWFIPFYNMQYAVFRTSLIANMFWASLCLTLTNFRPYNDAGIVYLALVPVAITLALLLLWMRKRQIEEADPETIRDPYILEMYCRFKLMKAGLLNGEDDAPWANTQHSADPEAGGGRMVNVNIRGGAGKEAVNKAVIQEIVEAYASAVKRMPKSCILHIFASSFHALQLKNRSQSIATCTKAESLRPKIDESFLLYRRRRLLDEKRGEGVVDYVAYDNTLKQAKKFEQVATVSMIRFWTELLRKKPAFEKLHTLGTEIASAVSNAQTYYLKLIKLSPDSPQPYRLYGTFLFHVVNDTAQGQALLDHADDLQADQADGENVAGDIGRLEFDYLSEDNVVITISADLANLGYILEVNPATYKVFGYRRHELISNNINKLLPSPFSEAHDTYLRRYLDTGFAKVVDQARLVLGLNRAGYIFPLTLGVKHAVDGKGRQTFIGVMKPQAERMDAAFVIISGELEVLHYTKVFGEWFGINPRDDPFGDEIDVKPKFDVLIPGASADKFASKQGMKVQHVKPDGTELNLVIQGDSAEAAGRACFILQVKLKESKKLSEQGGATGTSNQKLSPGCPFKGEAAGSHDGMVRCPTTENEDSVLPMNFSESAAAPPTSRRLASAFTADHESDEALPMNFSDAGPPKKPTGGMSTDTDMNRRNQKGSIAGSRSTNRARTPEMRASPNIEKGSSVGWQDSPKGDEDLNSDDGDDGQRSQTSKVSSNRGSAKSYMRRVISRKNDRINKRVQWLHLAYVACLIAITVIAIIECVVYRSYYLQTADTATTIRKKTDISLDLVTMTQAARFIDLHRRPANYWKTTRNLIPEAASRQLIDEVSARIRSESGLFMYCNQKNVRLQLSKDNRQLLPVEALGQVVASARFLIGANFSNTFMASEIAFILANAPFEVLRVVNACTVEDWSRTDNLAVDMPRHYLAWASVGPFVCIVIVLMIIQPLYVKVEDQRVNFYRMFYQIPKEYVKGIQESHMQRLISSAEDADDMDDEFLNKMALDKMQDNLKDDMGTDYVDAKDYNMENRAWVYRWKGSVYGDRRYIFLKSMLIFAITAIYSFVVGGLAMQTFSVIGDVGSRVFWSAQRSLLLRKATFFSRELLVDLSRNVSLAAGATVDMLPVAPNLTLSGKDLEGTLNDLVDLNTFILYGNPNYNLKGILKESFNHPVVNVEMTNACNVPGAASDCASFENEVMTRGFQAASDWYIKLVKALDANVVAAARSIGTPNITAIMAGLDLEMSKISIMDRNYLKPASDYTDAFFDIDFRSVVDWFSTFHMGFAIAYVSLLLVIYLWTIRPVLRGLGDDLRRTSSLVYMLPIEVFTKVESFRIWADADSNANNNAKKQAKVVN